VPWRPPNQTIAGPCGWECRAFVPCLWDFIAQVKFSFNVIFNQTVIKSMNFAYNTFYSSLSTLLEELGAVP
jgi:hypothetical protein